MLRPPRFGLSASTGSSPRTQAGGTGHGDTGIAIGISGGWQSTWAQPPDLPAEAAFGLSIALLALASVRGGPRWMASVLEGISIADPSRRRRFLASVSLVSAFLSLGYIAFYLRGGPRAAEAPAYFLQGRELARGHLAWLTSEPAASFHAVNLLGRLPNRLAGVFPPGFPLVLASGFLVGAPMVVGPLIAAAVAVATWWLALELATSCGEAARRAEAAGCIAAGLSLVCAALRYHTADVSPHGAAALAIAVAFAAALRGRRAQDLRFFAASGCALGALAAVQPWSTLAVGAAVGALAWSSGDRARALLCLSAAAPGLLLLLAANHTAAGHLAVSPTAAYVAMVGASSMGPSGVLPAVVRSLHRARAHMADVANFEPLALLPLAVLFGPRRAGKTAWLAAMVIVGQLLVHAPFTGQSPAPAAGCSVLADVLPFDHALVAIAVVRLFPRSIGRAASALFALALFGFAVHTSYSHRSLAMSDIGRPRFEPDVPRDANVSSGLLFFEDDAGYELASDPAVLASRGLEAVRMRGDDHDRLLYEVLGHPPSHRYVASSARSTVVAWSPPGLGDTWTFEAESDWPPFAAAGGHVAVETSVPPCTSGGRALVLTPSRPGAATGATATTTIELPVPHSAATPPQRRTWLVTPRVVQSGTNAAGTLSVVDSAGGPPLARWSWSDSARAPTCVDLTPQPIDLGGERLRAWLVLEAKGGAVALDRTSLHPK
jgi:hypothetical protein